MQRYEIIVPSADCPSTYRGGYYNISSLILNANVPGLKQTSRPFIGSLCMVYAVWGFGWVTTCVDVITIFWMSPISVRVQSGH